MYKALAGKAATFTTDLVKPTRQNRHSFRQLHNRTEVYKSSHLPATIVDWNSIPSSAFASCGIASEQVERFTNYVRSKVI